MKYKVDGTTYLTMEEVVICIRIEAKKAREENKKEFTVETNCFD